MKTKERLAQRLHSIGLFALEHRARQGEFSDYESKHACPKVALVGELGKIYKSPSPFNEMAFRLAQEVMEGKWDDSREEAEAWFTKEGKNLINDLT